MKVEIIKEFKHGVDTYFPGEVVIHEDNVCKFWCDAGWAKDVNEVYPTGNPSLTDVILLVDDVKEVQKYPELGV